VRGRAAIIECHVFRVAMIDLPLRCLNPVDTLGACASRRRTQHQCSRAPLRIWMLWGVSRIAECFVCHGCLAVPGHGWPPRPGPPRGVRRQARKSPPSRPLPPVLSLSHLLYTCVNLNMGAVPKEGMRDRGSRLKEAMGMWCAGGRVARHVGAAFPAHRPVGHVLHGCLGQPVPRLLQQPRGPGHG